MAEASTTELTVTLKQLGKHLRSVRRGKGLSLSEVARGAGLSRRELVAYERGKVPIPENDLWVLAGSCGVDVSELMPSPTSQELVPVSHAATSIGDTIAQLRKHQEDPGITPYLGTLHKLQALPTGKRIPVKDRELAAIAAALGGTPDSIDQKLQEVLRVSPDEARRLREMIVAPDRGKPKAIAAAETAVMFTPVTAPEPEPEPEAAPIATPSFAEPVQPLPVASSAFLDSPLDAACAQNVDVFEELARLPEPLPLGDPSAPVPDFLAPPADTFTDDPFALAPLVGAPLNGPPEGTVELVDADPGALPAATAFGLATDAPPIDVAMRQGSDRWDLGTAPGTGSSEPAADPTSWDTTDWQPPTPPGTDDGTPTGFWEGTDDWAPVDAPDADDAPRAVDELFADDAPVDGLAADTLVAAETVVDAATDSPFVADWEPDPWTASEPEPTPGDATPWTAEEWPRELAGDEGPWDHEPSPEAVNTGFFVDWGTPETGFPADEAEATVAPPAWDTTPTWETTPTWDTPQEWDTTPTWDTPQEWDTAPGANAAPEWASDETEPVGTVEVLDDDDEPGVDDQTEEPAFAPDALPPISWRADGPPALLAPAPEADAVGEQIIDEFVTAGPDWQLGNALPLVEVRGQGALVMRRADERWALADVTAPSDFVVEVDADFRSGPGLGVLFRASIDDEGRMSGYSFDIDPIYDGGGYLVRQWQADRELWNPIARVGAADSTSMYGSLTVRLVVTGDHLSALVNGVEVLTVENLKQASVDRGREAASGDRVGVQAWSSSDLVIDTLRVAPA